MYYRESMKNEKKSEAIKLRKKNKSYRQIAEVLGVSKSTVAYWFKDIDWSSDIKKQLQKRNREISRKRLEHLNNLKREKWSRVYKGAEDEARKEFEKNKKNRIFLLGLAIYWGEGDKNFSDGQVKVSNIDPELLRLFKTFLEKLCKIKKEKIKANLLLYSDLKADECLGYWSRAIGIEKNNFYKPVVIQGRRKTRRLSYGVCSLQVNSKIVKKKILVWIGLLSKLF